MVIAGILVAFSALFAVMFIVRHYQNLGHLRRHEMQRGFDVLPPGEKRIEVK